MRPQNKEPHVFFVSTRLRFFLPVLVGKKFQTGFLFPKKALPVSFFRSKFLQCFP